MREYKRYAPGMRTGKLTLISREQGGQKWKCVCDCGAEVITQIAGGARSCRKCSYAQQAENKKTHGKSGHTYRLYRIWLGMRNRCNNKNHKNYTDYGGRGIQVCLEWEDFIAFEAWAMANGYDENLEIDRVNNNGWYSPENCEWVSRNQQMRNTRKTHQVVLNGELRCVIDWCNTLGIHKTNAYKAAKNIGIRVDEYLAFKYYNPGAICTKENFAAWNLVCAMELEERLGYKFDKGD